MAIKLTEARLRQIIREEARKLVEMYDDNSLEGMEGVDAEAHRAMNALERELKGGMFDPRGLAMGIRVYAVHYGLEGHVVTRHGSTGATVETGDGWVCTELEFLNLLGEAWGSEAGEYFKGPFMPETLRRATMCHKLYLGWEAKHMPEIEAAMETLAM